MLVNWFTLPLVWQTRVVGSDPGLVKVSKWTRIFLTKQMFSSLWLYFSKIIQCGRVMTLKSCHIMQQKMKNELVSVHDRSKMVWGKKKIKKKDKRDCWCNVISCLFSPCRLNGRSIRKPSSAGVCGPFCWCCAFCRYLFYCDISRNCLCIPLSVRPSVRLCWYCLWLQASRLPLWNLPGGWQGENGHLRSELLRITLSDLFCWPPLYDCAMCCLLSADLIFQFTECKLALCRLWSQCSLCYVL